MDSSLRNRICVACCSVLRVSAYDWDGDEMAGAELRNPPCGRNCPNRRVGCQSECEKYMEFFNARRANDEKRSAAAEKAYQLDNMAAKRSDRAKRRRREK